MPFDNLFGIVPAVNDASEIDIDDCYMHTLIAPQEAIFYALFRLIRDLVGLFSLYLTWLWNPRLRRSFKYLRSLHVS